MGRQDTNNHSEDIFLCDCEYFSVEHDVLLDPTVYSNIACFMGLYSNLQLVLIN